MKKIGEFFEKSLAKPREILYTYIRNMNRGVLKVFRYQWNRLIIELHIKSFDKITEEKVTRYFFTPQELEKEPTVSISGKDVLDYVLTVQQLGESEVVLFDAMRSDDILLNLDAYESKGVLILHEGDTHKTPVRNISYNISYWYEVSMD